MKRLFFFLLFIILTLAIPLSKSYAQYTSSLPSSYLTPNVDSDVPQNMNTLVQSLSINILSTLVCYTAGVDPQSQNHQCLGWNSKNGKIGFVDSHGGALGMLSGMIVAAYRLPLHTGDYLRYMANNFHNNGIVPRAYAQGVGFQGLNPLITVLVAFRNLAYLFVVIIFIIVGIAIMLRVKIDPRTVMTVQNTIPKMIIGLLLVTLSFAIVGVLIDLTYVFTFLLLNIIGGAFNDTSIGQTLWQSASPYDATWTAFNNLNCTNPGGLGQATGCSTGFAGPIWDVAGMISHLINTAINSSAVGTIINIVANAVLIVPFIISVLVNILGGTFNWNANTFTGGTDFLVHLIVWIAIYIGIIIALFRFWLSLVTAYITILFAVILGPLRILGGILPGSPGGGFGGWFRDIIGNLLIFPVCLSFILLVGELAKILNSGPAGTASTAANAQNPSFMLPMVPGVNIGSMIAIVAIMAILPKLPATILETFKSKDIFGAGFGQVLGGGVKVLQRTAGTGVAMIAPTPTPGRAGGVSAGLRHILGG